MTRSRSGSFLRNPWITLLWAIGICFLAAEIVDSISGVTVKSDAVKSDQRPPAMGQAAAARDRTHEASALPPPAPIPAQQDIAR